MKTTFLVLASLLNLAVYACGYCPEEWAPCEKTYVDQDQLYVENETIYVAIARDCIIQTTAIYSDSDGLYFKDCKQQKCKDGEWYCTVCGHCNPNYKIWCEICWN